MLAKARIEFIAQHFPLVTLFPILNRFRWRSKLGFSKRGLIRMEMMHQSERESNFAVATFADFCELPLHCKLITY